MSRIMIVAGVHLDRAWTELGRDAGSAMRDWSRQMIGLVVEQAGQHQADTLLVLGGLTDRSSALPETVRYAAQVLGTFPGQVVVVPGERDWTDGHDLYSLTAWAANTTVATDSAYTSIVGTPLRVSAWTSPAPSAP